MVQRRITGYGVGSPKILLASPPVVAERNPATSDINYSLGQIWLNRSTANVYILTAISAGSATWDPFAGATAGVDTITGNSGGALLPTAGNINILGNNLLGINVTGSGSTLTVTGIQGSLTQVGVWESATAAETGALTDTTRVVTPAGLGPILLTPFVVAPGGAYTTIQSALDAANTAGGGVVYIRPGSYTEDLTLYDSVDLYGTPAVSQNQGLSTTIIGTHTPPASGHVGFNSIYFQSATDVFSSAVAGTTHLAFLNCESAVQSGYFLNLDNWTGTLEIYDNNPNSAGAPFAVDDGGINNSGGAPIIGFNAGIGFNGTNPMIISGDVFMESSELGADVTFQSAGVLDIQWVGIDGAVTFSGSTSGIVQFSQISSGAAAAVTMSSTGNIALRNNVIISSNSPAIDGAGAGTLTLGNLTFGNNSETAGTLTLAYSDSLLGASSVNGSLSLPQPGTTVQIEGGAVTDFIGTATLVAGTVTIAHTGITADDRVMVTRSDINGSTALGVFEVVKTPTTNFVINARNPADATIQTNDVSIVDYVITRQL